eukprot:4341831-Pyramimonas_sp.AAC.1
MRASFRYSDVAHALDEHTCVLIHARMASGGRLLRDPKWSRRVRVLLDARGRGCCSTTFSALSRRAGPRRTK